MVFSSLVFLWIFLPVIIILYYVIDEKYKNIFLLLGSLFFYAWGEPIYIFLMIFSIVVNWSIGLLIEKYQFQKKIFLIVSILFNVALLGYFKYFNFFIDIINQMLHLGIEYKSIKLPIGISFLLFRFYHI